MSDEVQTTRRLLQELRDLHTTGFVNDGQYAEHAARLERRLVDAVMNAAPADAMADAPAGAASGAEPPASTVASASAPAPKPLVRQSPRRVIRWSRFGTAVSLAVLLAALVGLGWWAWGAFGPSNTSSSGMTALGATAAERQAMSPEQLVAAADALRARLKSRPSDAEGWATLARIHTAMNRHSEAVTAFGKAIALRDNDAALLADFAEARAVANNGNLDGEPTVLLQRALALDPTQRKALSLAATAAFDRKDYTAAVAHWDALIAVAPADDPVAQKARRSVVEARQLAFLSAAAASADAAVPASAASGAGIRGTVTLAGALAARASPGDTVFVYARAVDGPPVPLAVIRKQVKDLPIQFTLDDSMAMWSSAKVSAYSKVIVTARVSKSGEGQPRNGDLQGQSAPVAPGTTGLQIEIGAVVQR